MRFSRYTVNQSYGNPKNISNNEDGRESQVVISNKVGIENVTEIPSNKSILQSSFLGHQSFTMRESIREVAD